MDYEQLKNAITAWALTQEDILGLMMVGSRARTDATIDAYSDLDLVVYTLTPEKYVADGSWLKQFGTLWMTALEKDGIEPEWFAIYEGALKVDLLFAKADKPTFAEQITTARHSDAYSRGLQILIDRYPSSGIIELPANTWTAPAPELFCTTIDHFLLNVTRAAKFMERGDLWRASHICSCKLRLQLLKMIEWHGRALNNADTWYDGRFIDSWAAPYIVERLPRIFAVYDAASLRNALVEILALFKRVMTETAAHYRYPVPETAYEHIENWILNLFEKAKNT